MELFKPKRKQSNRNVRLVAVKKLEDQDLLADIAKNDKDKWIRQIAIEKLEDTTLLIDGAYFFRRYKQESQSQRHNDDPYQSYRWN